MFTNNYRRFRKGAFTAMGISSSETYSVTPVNGTAISCYSSYTAQCDIGGWMKYGRCRVPVDVQKDSASSVYPGVYFGRGSTPANASDYKLEDVITSGLSVSSSGDVMFMKEGEGRYTATVMFILTNTSGEEQNIYEVGIFSPICRYTKEYFLTLMERTVLTEPITLAAGQSKLVTIRLVFHQSLLLDE